MCKTLEITAKFLVVLHLLRSSARASMRGGELRGLQRPLPKNKEREKRGRGRKKEKKKKEKRAIKRERKLNQSFQKHVFAASSDPQTPDRNGVGISRLASAPPFAKSCLRH